MLYSLRRRLALLICPELGGSTKQQRYVLSEFVGEGLKSPYEEAKERAEALFPTDDLEQLLAGFEADAEAWAYLIVILKCRRLRNLVRGGDDRAFLDMVREQVLSVRFPVPGLGRAQ